MYACLATYIYLPQVITTIVILEMYDGDWSTPIRDWLTVFIIFVAFLIPYFLVSAYFLSKFPNRITLVITKFIMLGWIGFYFMWWCTGSIWMWQDYKWDEWNAGWWLAVVIIILQVPLILIIAWAAVAALIILVIYMLTYKSK